MCLGSVMEVFWCLWGDTPLFNCRPPLPSFQCSSHVQQIQTGLAMVTVSQTTVNSAVNLTYPLPARPNCMWARSYLHCINPYSSSFYSPLRISSLYTLLLLSFERELRPYAAKSADLKNTWVQASCSASQSKCFQETSTTQAPIIIDMAFNFGPCTVCINNEWYRSSKQRKYLTIIFLRKAVLIPQIFPSAHVFLL